MQLGQRNPAERTSHARFAEVEAEVARMLEILQGHLAAGRSGPPAERPHGGPHLPAASAVNLLETG